MWFKKIWDKQKVYEIKLSARLTLVVIMQEKTKTALHAFEHKIFTHHSPLMKKKIILAIRISNGKLNFGLVHVLFVLEKPINVKTRKHARTHARTHESTPIQT